MVELSEYEQQFLENRTLYWKNRALRSEKLVKEQRVDELSDRYGLPYSPGDDPISRMLHNIENTTALKRTKAFDQKEK